MTHRPETAPCRHLPPPDSEGIPAHSRPLTRGMLARTRLSRLARAALFLAVVLSVAGSLGLHPEPGNCLHGLHNNGRLNFPEIGKSAGDFQPCLVCLLFCSMVGALIADQSIAAESVLPGPVLVVLAPDVAAPLLLLGSRGPPSSLQSQSVEPVLLTGSRYYSARITEGF